MGEKNIKGRGFAGLVDIFDEVPEQAVTAGAEKASSSPLPKTGPGKAWPRIGAFFSGWTPGAKLGLGLLVFFGGLGIWSSFQPPKPLEYVRPFAPSSTGESLTLSGLCWCRREKMILELSKGQIETLAGRPIYHDLMLKFNGRVDDYNSRCVNRSVLESDDQELNARNAEIKAAAEAQLGLLFDFGY